MQLFLHFDTTHKCFAAKKILENNFLLINVDEIRGRWTPKPEPIMTTLHSQIADQHQGGTIHYNSRSQQCHDVQIEIVVAKVDTVAAPRAITVRVTSVYHARATF